MDEKILIIEDEEDLVKGLKLNLADEGYEVDWASDGEEGLSKALNEAYDLIILDIMLPKMNGLDVCRELRQKHVTIPTGDVLPFPPMVLCVQEQIFG